MRKLLWTGLLIALSLLMANSTVMALTIGFQPSTQVVSSGDSLTVDVLATLGSGEIISAFDFDLSYDSSHLTATGVEFGTMLGDVSFFEALPDFNLGAAGLVDFAEVSLLSDLDLLTLQSSSSPIILATIAFDAIGPSESLLQFVNYGVAGNDIKGAGNIPYDLPMLEDGSVDVVGGAADPVPEPSTICMVGFGIAGVVRFGKRRRK